MATLGTKMQLNVASGTLTSDSINISVSKNITVTGYLAGVITITETSKAGTNELVYTADDFAAPAYLYLKNTDTTATDYIYIYDDTTAGDPGVLKLAGGDFAFLPLIADNTLRAYATTANTVLEYALFGTDQ
jgi:hypothetical protein